MKRRVSFGLILFSVALTACRQDAPAVNQNAPPSASATAAPTNVAVGVNEISANAGSTAKINSNQNAKPIPTVSPIPKASASPTASPKSSNSAKLKNYNGRGIVKGIDAENNSVIIDHEDIGDYMVAMEMPFPVVDKNILKKLKVGDKVTFVLETGVGVERIISIRKI